MLKSGDRVIGLVYHVCLGFSPAYWRCLSFLRCWPCQAAHGWAILTSLVSISRPCLMRPWSLPLASPLNSALRALWPSPPIPWGESPTTEAPWEAGRELTLPWDWCLVIETFIGSGFEYLVATFRRVEFQLLLKTLGPCFPIWQCSSFSEM